MSKEITSIRKNIESRISNVLTTLGGAGHIKYSPGTIGTLLGAVLAFLTFHISIYIASYVSSDSASEKVLLNGFLILFLPFLVISICLYITGTYYSNIYEQNHNKKDPKEIIVDELLGGYMVHFCCWPIPLLSESTKIHSALMGLGISYENSVDIIFAIFWLLVPLILFRLLDIYKPWPINWFDSQLEGGKSIMLDDLIAGFMAIILNYAIFFITEDLIAYLS